MDAYGKSLLCTHNSVLVSRARLTQGGESVALASETINRHIIREFLWEY